MKKIFLLCLGIVTLVSLSGCTWWDDTTKDWESDTKGIPRTVIVYSKTGEVLQEYKGEKVRISAEGAKITVNVDGYRGVFINLDVSVLEDGIETKSIKQ